MCGVTAMNNAKEIFDIEFNNLSKQHSAYDDNFGSILEKQKIRLEGKNEKSIKNSNSIKFAKEKELEKQKNEKLNKSTEIIEMLNSINQLILQLKAEMQLEMEIGDLSQYESVNLKLSNLEQMIFNALNGMHGNLLQESGLEDINELLESMIDLIDKINLAEDQGALESNIEQFINQV